MFLIRLTPSMREVVEQETTRRPRLWWTPCGMLAMATTKRLQLLQLTAVRARLLLGESGATRGAPVPVQKVAPLPTRIFSVFKTLAMACASITITTIQEPTGE
jgi:hypothetical protein